jgi:hypothetical protein
MTRVATPENEDFLLRIAQHGTASHVEKVVGKYRSVQAAEDNMAEREQDNARKLVYYQDSDGMWTIHASFFPQFPGVSAETWLSCPSVFPENPLAGKDE